jgi:hypothetical protein
MIEDFSPEKSMAIATRIKFDGEKILDMLERDLETDSTPVTDFRTIKNGSDVLDGLFSALIKEYIDRRDSKATTTGGANKKPDSVAEVVKKIKASYTAYRPANDKSRDACLGLFGDRLNIGSGKYGDVFSGTSPHDPENIYAVKAILIHPFSPPAIYRNVVSEIEIGKEMGELGVGPRVHDVHWCDKDGGLLVMIVSDLMTLGDLSKFSQERAVTDAHVKSIRKKLKIMHDAGYTHNDLHARNILVNETADGAFEFFLGDFGFSGKTTNSADARKEMRDLKGLSRLVTRDRLRGVLYRMVEDGRLKVDINFKPTLSSSSVWAEDHSSSPSQ